MVLSLFGKARGEQSLDDLIKRKQYGKAVDLLKIELHKRRKDRSLRMKLAHVLELAGRPEEAAGLLHGLADELALGGFAAQAIALLKRVQTMQPGRPEIEEKLAYLITQQSRPAPDPWAVGAGPAPEPSGRQRLPEFGMEEFGEEELGLELGPSAPLPASVPPVPSDAAAPEPAELAPPAETAAPAADDAEQPGDVLSEDAFRDELVGMIDDLFNAGPGETAPVERVETALFRDFTPDELADVIRGLKLRRFEAGEILVSEGEPGQSLYVLASGRVRAFIRDAQGRNVEVRQLVEGDFFGEAAILTGQARSATLTAASDCELLELERAALDEIAGRKPRVWDVLLEFHKARRDNTLESLIRGQG